MTRSEKWGLAITILSLFIRQAGFFPEAETVAIFIYVMVFLAGWYLFIFGGRKL